MGEHVAMQSNFDGRSTPKCANMRQVMCNWLRVQRTMLVASAGGYFLVRYCTHYYLWPSVKVD